MFGSTVKHRASINIEHSGITEPLDTTRCIGQYSEHIGCRIPPSENTPILLVTHNVCHKGGQSSVRVKLDPVARTWLACRCVVLKRDNQQGTDRSSAVHKIWVGMYISFFGFSTHVAHVVRFSMRLTSAGPCRHQSRPSGGCTVCRLQESSRSQSMSSKQPASSRLGSRAKTCQQGWLQGWFAHFFSPAGLVLCMSFRMAESCIPSLPTNCLSTADERHKQ